MSLFITDETTTDETHACMEQQRNFEQYRVEIANKMVSVQAHLEKLRDERTTILLEKKTLTQEVALQEDNLQVFMCMCACVCVRVCVRLCVRVYVCACVCAQYRA